MRSLFYFGGSSPVGGIESFAANLLDGFREFPISTDLLVWGENSDFLRQVSRHGNVTLHRSFWRWGCRYGLPDKLILPYGKMLLKKSDIVLFGKTFSPDIHFSLDRTKNKLTSKPSFVYITPYKPSELWYPTLPDGDLERVSRMLNTFDVIVVQAESFKEDLTKLEYKGRVEVIPYVPPVETPVNGFPDYNKTIRIGFLGRLQKQKNLEFLLNAFAQSRKLWKKNTANLELHLFGDGSEMKKLLSVRDKLKLKDSVYFHGSITSKQVPEKIDSCHLFAFSSITEGQCLAAIEILSRGRPIVATPVGALPDIVNKEVGKLVPLDHQDEFSNALVKSLENIYTGYYEPSTIRNYYDQNFARDVVIRKYWKLINDIIKDKANGIQD